MGEGKRLFAAYNCNGCHAQGGGGIGPPLMDSKVDLRVLARSDLLDHRPGPARTACRRSADASLTIRCGSSSPTSSRSAGRRRRTRRPSRNDDMSTTKPEVAQGTRTAAADGAPMKEYHIQSVLNSAGPQAARIESLWWLMFWVCTVVFVARHDRARHRHRAGAGAARRWHVPESTLTRNHRRSSVGSLDHRADRPAVRERTHRAGQSDRCRRRTRSRYGSPAISGGGTSSIRTVDPSLQVTTANELHLPVGRPVVDQPSGQRRHPQLLGAEPAREDRSDPGPRNDTLMLRADRAGRVSGPVRRVLRRPARAHGLRPSSRSRRSSSRRWLSAQRRPAPDPGNAQTDPRPRRRRTGAVRDVPHGPGHERRRPDGARPHALRQPEHDWRPAPRRTRAATSPGGSPIRSTSSQATACRRPGSRPTTCRRWSRIWRRCSELAAPRARALPRSRGPRAGSDLARSATG